MSLAPVTELILRNRDAFAGRRLLLAGTPPDTVLAELPLASATHWLWDYGHALRWQQAGAAVHFGIAPPAGDFDSLLLFMPKAKPRLAWLLAEAARSLPADSTLWLAGAKREGIDSAGRWLAAVGEAPVRRDRARHCVLWESRLTAAVSAAPGAMACRTQTVAGQTLQLCSLPGVFSDGSLDAGTALLLEHLPLLPPGPVLDFGSGCGVLGAFVLARQPTLTLEAVDSDAFAVAATEATLAANGQAGRAYASDGLSAVGGGFRTIISNPPFHDGIHTDYGMTRGFIRDMARHLRPDGELWLVANRFLPYADALAEALGEVETPAANSRFVLYRARPRR